MEKETTRKALSFLQRAMLGAFSPVSVSVTLIPF